MIRKLQEADINRVATIWFAVNITAHNFISAQYWMDHFEIVQEMFPQAEVYVYEEGASIQGFIGLQEDYIAGIFVSGEAQSSGIGRRLIHFAKGIRSQLRLDVYQKNTRAVRFRAAINHTAGKYKPASRFPCRKQKPMDLSLEASRLFQYLLRAV